MLPKISQTKKVRCKYGTNQEKTYTFLCSDEILSTLNKGDLVVVDSNGKFDIVQVLHETTEKLDPSITYKHILLKL